MQRQRAAVGRGRYGSGGRVHAIRRSRAGSNERYGVIRHSSNARNGNARTRGNGTRCGTAGRLAARTCRMATAAEPYVSAQVWRGCEMF